MAVTAPTKGNLMAARRSRALAENGWELMDKKRNILIRELMARVERAKALQAEIDSVFQSAYGALALAEIDCPDCAAAAAMVPEDDSLKLRWRSVMGVEIPAVSSDEDSRDALPYGLAQSSSALDSAYRCFTQVKALLAELAETEITVYRLGFAIQKSQKRANALENIVIPGLDLDIQRIDQALAEKEREEFVRQKVIKARKEK
jgi:V/A-type H+-transporting ATPase subunit D